MGKKQPLKQGEKILFGIFGAFLGLAVLAYALLEIVRALSEQGKLGSKLFRERRCTACHRAMRNGTNMGLNLDGIGSRKDADWLYGFLSEPEKYYGAPTLDHGYPPKEAAYVADLPENERRAIAVFLSELKSEKGSPSAWVPPEDDSGFIDKMIQLWAPAEWKEKYEDVREK